MSLAVVLRGKTQLKPVSREAAIEGVRIGDQRIEGIRICHEVDDAVVLRIGGIAGDGGVVRVGPKIREFPGINWRFDNRKRGRGLHAQRGAGGRTVQGHVHGHVGLDLRAVENRDGEGFLL